MFESERQTFTAGHAQLTRFILNFVDFAENTINQLQTKNSELEVELKRLREKYGEIKSEKPKK
jgi:cell division septum initiation protein DivIVA